MASTYIIFLLFAVIIAGFVVGRNRAVMVVGGERATDQLHSRPAYYGAVVSLGCGFPALLVFSVWLLLEDTIIIQMVIAGLPDTLSNASAEQLGLIINDLKNLVKGNTIPGTIIDPDLQSAADHYRKLWGLSRAALVVVVLSLAIGAVGFLRRKITPAFRARNHVEKAITLMLIACSTIAVFTTIGIVLSVLYESMLFFKAVPLYDFLFGLTWSPQTAIRADQVGSSGAFGAVPVFTGTLLISAIAMTVAVPIGLMSAIYLSEYASRKMRAIVKPLMEILAGIPTVVYGFFAALTVAPLIRDLGTRLGMEVSSESALAAGVVMGIMIIPFVSSISDDVINAVPHDLRDGSYGLGATKSETIRQVIIPAALPGIVGGILLGVSRAIGETMIVVMAAGLSANLTANPLKAVTTVTVQIVTLLVGDQEFDSPKTLAAFALGLLLFIITLILNVMALYVVRKYREQYE